MRLLAVFSLLLWEESLSAKPDIKGEEKKESNFSIVRRKVLKFSKGLRQGELFAGPFFPPLPYLSGVVKLN